MQLEPVYLDYAATAPLDPAAAAAVAVGQGLYGNPSSDHEAGRVAAEALGAARASVARLLGVAAAEVVLTSGGSEADTTALWGTFAARRFSGHLVTTSIEHSAVLENARALAELGVEVTFLDPEPSGHVDPADVAAAMRPDTVLVSVMHANNETGAIQPVEAIAGIAGAAGVAFHTDAVHTAGKIDLTAVGATMISVSAHKFGGPRGIGALSVRAGHRIAPLIRGGSQENGLRAGTENLAAAMGMAAAAEACLDRITPDYRRSMRTLRDRLVAGLAEVGGVEANVTGPVVDETVSLRFRGIRGDTLADTLDLHGIYVSTGSACHAGDETVSHVLTAQGLSEHEARSAVRFSLGPGVDSADVDRVVAVTASAVGRLRRMAGVVGADR
ncbi:MAG: cysteine desulfurase [Mycobacterium sp.]|nr:cysteine desulfurase [Mycobacterium sp.]